MPDAVPRSLGHAAICGQRRTTLGVGGPPRPSCLELGGLLDRVLADAVFEQVERLVGGGTHRGEDRLEDLAGEADVIWGS